MPNAIERLLRAVFVYTSLFWIITGLWGIPQAWLMWRMLEQQGTRYNNELFCLLMLIFVYGTKPIVGVVGLCYFRELAGRQYRRIPDLASESKPKWHDTNAFAVLLATVAGLYALHLSFAGLSGLIAPLLLIGMGQNDMTGIAVIDVWYHHWQSILIPACGLFCAILLFTYTEKIAASVTRMIETTPKPNEGESDEPKAVTAKGESDAQAG